MQPTSPSAFLLSTALHGVGVALVLLFTYGVHRSVNESPKIFELVAGEGDNYMATEAPALGTPGGVGIAMPEMAVVKAAPPEPSPVVAAPLPEPVIERAPVKAAKAPDAIPDLQKLVKQKAAITQIRKEANDRRARAVAERKAKEAALKSQRMTKADFDKQNKAKASTAKKGGASAPKIAKIDAEGIAKGVIGGSTANKVGGAGGTALTRTEGDAVDAYTALLQLRIQSELNEKPGVGAGLVVEVEIRILANGTLTGIRITRSSGSQDFDQVVKEALAALRMPPRPAGLSELQRFPIRGVE